MFHWPLCNLQVQKLILGTSYNIFVRWLAISHVWNPSQASDLFFFNLSVMPRALSIVTNICLSASDFLSVKFSSGIGICPYNFHCGDTGRGKELIQLLCNFLFLLQHTFDSFVTQLPKVVSCFQYTVFKNLLFIFAFLVMCSFKRCCATLSVGCLLFFCQIVCYFLFF